MGRNLTNLPISASFQYLLQQSGSAVNDGLGNDVTSLDISASFASQAGTAGFASQAGTSGFAVTASFAENFNPAATASYALFAEQAGTAGFATSASQATNANNADQAELVEIFGASNNSNYRVMFAASNGFQKPYIDSEAFGFYYNPSTNVLAGLNSVTATTFNGLASSAVSASFATTASYALNAGASTLQEVLDNDNTATQDIILTGDIQATNITASGADITNLVVGDITGSNATFASASIGFLTAVTGSVTKIGDAYILLNTNDINRYAGIKVEDSGSATPTNFTASLNFDSLTNDWFYEYTSSGDPDNFGVVMFGPEYNTIGVPTYPTANTLVKGNGGHHLLDSSITDDGTDVVVSANISASGFVSASTYYGDGSNLSGVGSGAGFPFTGTAVITGSIVQGEAGVTFSGTNGAVLASATDVTVSNGTYSSAISAKTSTLSITGENNGIFSGREAQITGNGNGNALLAVEYGGILGNGSNRVVIGGYGNNVTDGGFDTVIGGESNSVTGGGYNHIFGSVGSSNGGGNKNVIIGGESNTISGNTRGVVIGGTGMTTSKNDEVVVPHLTISGSVAAFDNGQIAVTSSLGTGSLIDNVGPATSVDAIYHIVHLTQAEYDALTPDDNTLYLISGSETLGDTVVSGSLIGQVNAISVASSTGSLDCSAGNYFTLGLANAADTRLEASNIQIGQTINIKITNNATAAGTISFGPEFEFEGGSAFTATAATNAVDIITAVSFDGTSLQVVGVKNFS